MKHLDHYLLIAMAVIGAGIIVVRGEIARRAEASDDEPASTRAVVAGGRTSDALVVAGLLALAAGVIHASVVKEHFEETPLFGAFFLLIAALQVAWAVALYLRPSRRLLVLGACGSLAIAALWLV